MRIQITARIDMCMVRVDANAGHTPFGVLVEYGGVWRGMKRAGEKPARKADEKRRVRSSAHHATTQTKARGQKFPAPAFPMQKLQYPRAFSTLLLSKSSGYWPFTYGELKKIGWKKGQYVNRYVFPY
jgi:hypothetical protein